MKGNIPAFQCEAPRTLRDALELIREPSNDWTPLAGGTDLMVLMESGKLPEGSYLSLWAIEELKQIEVTDAFVTLGALTTYTSIARDPVIQKEFPNLVDAALETGAVAIQNRGTLGGNIINASPAADSPPALLVYGAEVELSSAEGSKWVAYDGFHLDYKKTQRGANQLLTRIRLPRLKTGKHFYRKVGTRKAQAISKICLAAFAKTTGNKIDEISVALASVAPIPFKCVQTAEFLKGKELSEDVVRQAKEQLANEIKPIDDIRSTRDYRTRVAQNVLAQCLESFRG